MSWELKKRPKEGDFMLVDEHAREPLLFVRWREGGDLAERKAKNLAESLHVMLNDPDLVLAVLALRELDAFLKLDEVRSTQLMLFASKDHYEVGFVRFGALMRRTSQGRTLAEALIQARNDLPAALEESDAAPPFNPGEE